ncbi:MAG: malate dehydrogenase [Polyangiaceae bacterium]|nr:malate dehydrogenase [Polyangiaceae bacterium]
MAQRRKIGVIGAGNIGGELARLCASKELGDVVMLDIPAKESFAKGKALDLEQNSSVIGYDASITGTGSWADLAGADVVIVTAGIPRKPGQSRDDLVAVNLPIIRDVADNAKKHCPDAFVVVISNPLDAMVYEFQRRAGWNPNMVAGMAGVLDSARFQLFVARAAGVSIKDVRAMVLGGHGDDMVPILSQTTINGVPATQFIAKDALDAIVKRTRGGGGEIVNLMGTSAYYAPASSAVAMAEAYLSDQKRLLAAACWLTGQYGYKDIYMGVPCVIGGKGVEKIIELSLNDDEKAMLAKSAASVQGIVDVVNKSALGRPSSRGGAVSTEARRRVALVDHARYLARTPACSSTTLRRSGERSRASRRITFSSAYLRRSIVSKASSSLRSCGAWHARSTRSRSVHAGTSAARNLVSASSGESSPVEAAARA